MGKKKTNSIIRIQKAVRASKLKFTYSLQDTSKESIPGSLKTTIIEHPPSVPCGDEYNALQEILSTTPGLFWKPRRKKEYIIDSSDLRKFQILGFEHYADYIGYLTTWNLQHHTQDFDFLFNDKENNSND